MKKLSSLSRNRIFLKCDACDCIDDTPRNWDNLSGARCSNCGSVICTPTNFLHIKLLIETAESINKWFGWLTWFGVKGGEEDSIWCFHDTFATVTRRNTGV